jgi:hypothetical protein
MLARHTTGRKGACDGGTLRYPDVMRRPLAVIAALLAALFASCATPSTLSSPAPATKRASLYPTRPQGVSSPPLADPPLSRPTMHLTLTRAGLEALLDALVPAKDGGDYALLGARAWGWERGPFALAFDDARKAMTATTSVTATVELPGTTLSIPLSVKADVQPVLTSEHRLALQAVTVKVTSADRRLRLADATAGVIAHVEKTLTEKLTTMSVDLRPTLSSLYDTLGTPLFLPLSPAQACFALDVRALEAGPTVLADGFEKELALTVAPSLTMPCTMRDASNAGAVVVVDEAMVAAGTLPARAPLPPLKNASGVEGGPFTLTIPVAAGYDELQKAMTLAFPDGKLAFSSSQPGLFITEPEVYAADGDVVVRVRLGGFAMASGVQIDVDGDLYLAGRPMVRDNFLEFPDLAPTVATEQALLKAALALKEDELTAAVKKALRLDLSQRLQAVRAKLEGALTKETVLVDGVAPLCTSVEIGRIAVSDVHVHDPYLRATVTTTALFSASLPCPGRPAVSPVTSSL